jgi:hypothetical protein
MTTSLLNVLCKFCTKITSRLKHVVDKLAKFERTNAFLMEYIKVNSIWMFAKETPKNLVLFYLLHMWLQIGHFDYIRDDVKQA